MESMRVSDIRPRELFKAEHDFRARDLEKISALAAQFVNVDCPACGSLRKEFRFKKTLFTFVECSDCETLYVNPRPTASMLSDFYSYSENIKYWNESVFPQSEVKRRLNIFAPRAKKVAELCEKHNAGRDLLVDVGAGFGTFCEEMKKLNFFQTVLAVEPAKSLAETCRKKGIEVLESPVEKVKLDRVSVITNFELIEHLFSPANFISDCGKLLPRGGLLIVTTPNIKGFDMALLGEKCDNIDGPNHINYFHPKSLGSLMERNGFDVIECLTPGKLDAELVRMKILEGQFNVNEQPFLKKVLVDDWETLGSRFQQFLAENRLSSHLWMVGRKK